MNPSIYLTLWDGNSERGSNTKYVKQEKNHNRMLRKCMGDNPQLEIFVGGTEKI